MTYTRNNPRRVGAQPAPRAPRAGEDKREAPRQDKAQPKLTISSWFASRAARRPDWSKSGFEAACVLYINQASTKDWIDVDELCEYMAHGIALLLRQRDVEVHFVARDRKTGRPLLIILLADRHKAYHEVEIVVPELRHYAS